MKKAWIWRLGLLTLITILCLGFHWGRAWKPLSDYRGVVSMRAYDDEREYGTLAGEPLTTLVEKMVSTGWTDMTLYKCPYLIYVDITFWNGKVLTGALSDAGCANIRMQGRTIHLEMEVMEELYELLGIPITM
ncbi:hypothetical protein LJC20_04180 [Eubacteriales bacterium OttesenSCG-928-M02]|nr:hypothetical protein [Eubacteriales bacterium OttesenSCG-928-M02]